MSLAPFTRPLRKLIERFATNWILTIAQCQNIFQMVYSKKKFRCFGESLEPRFILGAVKLDQ